MPVDDARSRSPQAVPHEKRIPRFRIEGICSLKPPFHDIEHVLYNLSAAHERIVLLKNYDCVHAVVLCYVACSYAVSPLHPAENVRRRSVDGVAKSTVLHLKVRLAFCVEGSFCSQLVEQRALSAQFVCNPDYFLLFALPKSAFGPLFYFFGQNELSRTRPDGVNSVKDFFKLFRS